MTSYLAAQGMSVSVVAVGWHFWCLLYPERPTAVQFPRRHDEPVTTSSGEVRAGTDGSRTRAMFKKLPGVGNRMALHWWQKGLRCAAAFLVDNTTTACVRSCSVLVVLCIALVHCAPAGDLKTMRQSFRCNLLT